MLAPEYLAGISAPLQDIYGQLQSKIEADIARRIKDAHYVTDTAAWQIEKLKQLGASQAYIAEQIATHTGMSTAEVQTAFRAAGLKTCAADEATRSAAVAAGKLSDTGIPLAASDAVKQILRAGMRRTDGTLQRLTGTLAEDASGKLNKYLDEAQLQIMSGAFTPQQATNDAVSRFAADGVTAFEYATGARTSVEAAVRRALVTGVNQATAEVSLANAAEMGTDLVEVTSHADARPEHAEWQGKVYSIHGGDPKHRKLSEATGYGTGAGLCGWNCRHSFYAFIDGVSEPLTTPSYDPKMYEAEQRQRYYERMIRTWKRRANTLSAGGVDPTAANKRVAYWQQLQRDHVKKYDLARMYDREKVYGLKEWEPKKKAAPVKKEPTKEELLAAKKDRLREESRERTRRWREAKKTEAAKAAEEVTAAKAAEEAAAAARAAEEAAKAAAEAAAAEAAEAAARKALEDAAAESARKAAAEEVKKEALRAESRERTRRWREAKKAAADASKAEAAKAAAEAEEAARKAAEAEEAAKAAEKAIADKAAAAEAEKEALRAASRERTRKWREAKKAAAATTDAAEDAKYTITVYHGTEVPDIDVLKVRPEAALRSVEEEPLAGLSFSPDITYAKDFSGTSGTIYETKIDKRKFVSVYTPMDSTGGYATLSKDDTKEFLTLIDDEDRVGATKFLKDRGFEGGVIRGRDVTGDFDAPDEIVIIHDVSATKMGTLEDVAKTAKKAKPEEPIRAFSKRVGEPGTYQVYRSTGKTIPKDGITAFHGLVGDAASVSDMERVKEYHVVVKKPLVIDAPDKSTARAKAFEKLTGETSRGFTGDAGAAVAKAMRDQGYDSIIYKLPGDRFELDPLKFDMAKTTEDRTAIEKALKEKAEKEAAEKAAKKAAEEAAAKKARAEAAVRAEAAARAREARRQAKGLPAKRAGPVPDTLKQFDALRDSKLADRGFATMDDNLVSALDFAQQAVDQGVPRSRISQDNLMKVLGDGKLKTQIELDAERKAGKNVAVTSGGWNNPEGRKKASAKLFGTDISKTKATDYEYYGYIWDDDFVADFEWDGPSQYGGSTLQFKPRVRERTTFTCGDSLGDSYVPAYLDDVTPCWSKYNTRDLADAADAGLMPSVANLCSESGAGYVELQLHGGITLDDVESFVIGPNEYDRRGLDKKLIKALNERDIKVGLVERARNGRKTFRWLKPEDWE